MKRLALLIILGVVAWNWSASCRLSSRPALVEPRPEIPTGASEGEEFVPGEGPATPSPPNLTRRRIVMHRPHRVTVSVAQDGGPPAPPEAPASPAAATVPLP